MAGRMPTDLACARTRRIGLLLGLMAVATTSCVSRPEGIGAAAVSEDWGAGSFQESPTDQAGPTEHLMPPDGASDASRDGPGTESDAARGVELQIGGGEFARGAVGDAAAPDDRVYEFVFRDAALDLVIDEVVGGLIGADYVIEPNASARVTVRVSEVRGAAAVIAALNAALSPQGVAISRQGQVFVVSRSGDTEPGGAFAVIEAGGDVPPGAGAVIVSPRYLAVDEAVRMISPLVGNSVSVSADAQRGLLILRGREEDLTAALNVLETFDVDWMAEISFGVFELRYAEPSAVVAELNQVMGPAAQGVEFVVVERLGAIIAIAPRAGALNAAAGWIARLDRAPRNGGADSTAPNEGLLTYEPLYADAGRLAEDARALYGEFSDFGRADFGAVREVLPNASARQTVNEFGFEPGAGTARRDGRGPEAVRPLPLRPRGEDDVTISVSADANMVLARGPSEELARLRELFERLDRPQAQVLIEAAIVEVTLTDELRYGVSWAGEEGQQLDFAFSDAPTGAVTSRFPGFSVSYVNVGVQAAINALASVTDVELVSRPRLMALQNQTAVLQIGDQVPIVTQSAVSITDPGAPIVNSVEFRDTGVILTVTPRVRGGDLVEIDVSQEVSDVAQTSTSGIDSPTISQRRLESTFVAPSGQAVALGGLISSTRSLSETGVPVLMDVPFLGRLFRSNSDIVSRTELIVLLTPTILRGPEDALAATADMRRAVTRLEERLNGRAEDVPD